MNINKFIKFLDQTFENDDKTKNSKEKTKLNPNYKNLYYIYASEPNGDKRKFILPENKIFDIYLLAPRVRSEALAELGEKKKPFHLSIKDYKLKYLNREYDKDFQYSFIKFDDTKYFLGEMLFNLTDVFLYMFPLSIYVSQTKSAPSELRKNGTTFDIYKLIPKEYFELNFFLIVSKYYRKNNNIQIEKLINCINDISKKYKIPIKNIINVIFKKINK